jgi:hypothetical protein
MSPQGVLSNGTKLLSIENTSVGEWVEVIVHLFSVSPSCSWEVYTAKKKKKKEILKSRKQG